MNRPLQILVLVLASTFNGTAAQPTAAQAALSAVQTKVLHDVLVYGSGIAIITGLFGILSTLLFEKKRAERRKYYNEDYLQSDAWKRKRHVVLKRDNWTCVYCNAKATDVHHKRYARQIGKEPIDWLVSVCPRCHAMEHPQKQAIR